MLKKITVVTALSTALLFGGTISNSVDAAAKDQAQNFSYKTKIYYSTNGNWQQVSNKDINSYLSKYFSSSNWKNIKWDWKNDSHKGEAEVEKQDPPKQEAPKEPVKVEQNQPSKAPTADKKPVQKPETPTADKKPVQKPEAPAKENTTTNKPAQSTPQGQNYALSQFEQQVVDLTNQERAKQGLSALKVDWELSRVAREKSRDMSVNGYFSHNSPTYGSPFDMMKSWGISYNTAGENIAKGQRTPQEVVNAWMNSEGHRANIMNGKFTHIGVGYVESGNVWTQQFIGK
ncbi:CAP domain-containing protein [Virgibacillus sp. LDC-1]|uniref:CAP domain-containing protein n=1 Tax=Virgibacillus sp. LDC-1 TaxID=3039856 RepID=UPI0024DEA6B0|nr:CAP domain-containing protein [Virgibacillus sp. LDC-1]